jgi:hypothetical protein
MGLDTTIYAKAFTTEPKTVRALQELIEVNPPKVDYPSFEVSIPVIYWRKAYAITDWLMPADYGQGDHYISRESLEELLDICEKVLADKDQADDLLPNESTYFGKEPYDDYYFDQVTDAVTQLKSVLSNESLKSWDFYFNASW